MAGNERRPVMAGNWKMHHNHLEAIQVVQKLSYRLESKDYDLCEVVVCPTFTALRSIQTVLDADNIPMKLGAQNCHWKDDGAYTGEVSPPMLAKLNVAYVIIGHSERRTLHQETDSDVNAKVIAAQRHGLVPVICVGETAEDLEAHGPSAVPVRQLRTALEGVDGSKGLVVAYEPVWAIGSGQAATPEQAQQVCGALRTLIAELLGDDVAAATRILYGGSVKSTNIASFLREPDVDGALVGGASLDIDEFSSIVRFKKHIGA